MSSKKGNKAPAEGKLEGYTAEELAFVLGDDNGPEAQAYKDRKKVRERAREGGREGGRERRGMRAEAPPCLLGTFACLGWW